MIPLYIGYSFHEIKKTFQTKKYLNIQLTMYMYLQRLNYLVNIQNYIFAQVHVHMHARGKKIQRFRHLSNLKQNFMNHFPVSCACIIMEMSGTALLCQYSHTFKKFQLKK